VAGTIGALRNNLGVIGVAAERARLYIFNIFGPYGSFPESVSTSWAAALQRQALADMAAVAAAAGRSWGCEWMQQYVTRVL
jgi:hypothetical protein